MKLNIAKGTTGPRVEGSNQRNCRRLIKLSFKIFTKIHLKNLDQTSAIIGANQFCPSKTINYHCSALSNYPHQPELHQFRLNNSSELVSDKGGQCQ